MTEARAVWRRNVHLRHSIIPMLVVVLVLTANIWAASLQPHQIPEGGMTISKTLDKNVLVVGSSLNVRLTVNSYEKSPKNVTIGDWFPLLFVLATSYTGISTVYKAPTGALTQLIWTLRVEALQQEVLTYGLKAVTPSGEQTLPRAEIAWANNTVTSREENVVKIVESNPLDTMYAQVVEYLQNIVFHVIEDILVIALTALASYVVLRRKFRAAGKREPHPRTRST